jgi:hypothetical protein
MLPGALGGNFGGGAPPLHRLAAPKVGLLVEATRDESLNDHHDYITRERSILHDPTGMGLYAASTSRRYLTVASPLKTRIPC